MCVSKHNINCVERRNRERLVIFSTSMLIANIYLVGIRLELAQLDTLLQPDPTDGSQILDVHLTLLDVVQQNLEVELKYVKGASIKDVRGRGEGGQPKVD